MYTVKQVAEKLDMNPHTVRVCTDKNLIPDLKREKSLLIKQIQQNGKKYRYDC